MKVRINRYLSQCGEMSRRAADEAIDAGRVSINGIPAVMGQNVDPENDRVTLDKKPLNKSTIYYLAAYKPRNMVTTMHDPEGRPCIRDIIPERYKGVYPAGRLDFDAEGLLILTNDGDMANAIHHPSRNMDKVYIVELKPEAPDAALARMSGGIEIDGRLTRRARVDRIKDQRGITTVKITLRQGLKNQIKRMAEAVGLNVVSIKRISIGSISLGSMRPGNIRELTDAEVGSMKNLRRIIKDT
jgi:23S rRNA pseudouridine2605 synthase